jgi:hypothetical protein
MASHHLFVPEMGEGLVVEVRVRPIPGRALDVGIFTVGTLTKNSLAQSGGRVRLVVVASSDVGTLSSFAGHDGLPQITVRISTLCNSFRSPFRLEHSRAKQHMSSQIYQLDASCPSVQDAYVLATHDSLALFTGSDFDACSLICGGH